jgi:leucine dehydrogenase
MSQSLKENLDVVEIAVPGYEKVLKVSEESSGLNAIICIHNTVLGPALGGTRIYPYPTFEAALNDVMRLSKGMTHKSAVAQTGLGGGKAVIIADPRKNKTKEKLWAFGHAVNQLEGLYITAEDVGCAVDDVDTMHSVTPYVVGLSHSHSSGNPGPFTAWGVFRGIQAVLKRIYGDEKVEGRTIAVQGLGSVGGYLIEHLFWHGAKLIISDINVEKAMNLAKKYKAEFCPPEEIMNKPCDVFSPCAMGGILHSGSISELRCKAVAGAANNQLLDDSHAEELMQAGILYAPDVVINAGGLINVTCEISPTGYNPVVARNQIHALHDQLWQIFELADQQKISTHAATVALAEYRIANKIGKRTTPPYFHSR